MLSVVPQGCFISWCGTARALPAARPWEHPNLTFSFREGLELAEKPGWSLEQTLNLRIWGTTKPSSTEGMRNCIFMVLAGTALCEMPSLGCLDWKWRILYQIGAQPSQKRLLPKGLSRDFFFC